MRDVVVVGAGIAGCALASWVGKAGYDVLVVDAKPHFIPKVCSGLISVRIDSLLRYPSKAVLNEVRGARFFAGKDFVELKREKTQAYVMDRSVLDFHLLEKASKHCDVEFGWKIVGVEKKDSYAICTLKKGGDIRKVKARVVVGADGALSTTRKLIGAGKNLKVITGALAYVEEERVEEDVVELHYDRKLAPGFFAWRIPRGDGTVEYGLGTDSGNAVENLVKFCKRFGHEVGRRDVKVGFIPLGLIDRSCDDNILLLGDAASQVKPYSGGGAVYSLICARSGSDAITKALEMNNFSKEFFTEHAENVWKDERGRKTEAGMAIRTLMDDLDEGELEELFRIVGENKVSFLRMADMDFLGT